MRYSCPTCLGHVEFEIPDYDGSPLQCPHCKNQVGFTPLETLPVVQALPPPVPDYSAAQDLLNLASGQPIHEVSAALKQLATYCTPGEVVQALALQSRLMTAGFTPDVVATTGRRMIVLNRRLFGLTMWDALWIDIVDVWINESLTGASLFISTVNRRTITIEKLNKEAARKLYRICQAREEEMRAARHAQVLHHAAVSATHINVNLGNNHGNAGRVL